MAVSQIGIDGHDETWHLADLIMECHGLVLDLFIAEPRYETE